MGKQKKMNKHSLSLPNLKNPVLNTSLKNYPRPLVIRTKEFKRKSKPDLKVALKNAKPLTLEEINVDSSKIFPPKENNENKDNIFCGTRMQQDEQLKFFLTENEHTDEYSPDFDSPINKSFTKKYFDTVKEMQDEGINL